MDKRLKDINDCFASDNDAIIQVPFELHEQIVRGSILVIVGEVKLAFDVEIFRPYPLQFHNHETIRFINKDLIEYNHVNADGSICVHTFHSPYLKRKIELDLNSLKHWISRYYVNKENDQHYEHIVVPDKEYNGSKTVFLFTEVNCIFSKYEFGYFEYSYLSDGNNINTKYTTYIVQCFNKQKQQFWCSWNSAYKSLKRITGLYLFIENPPVKFKRFAVTNWKELEPYVNQSFLKNLV